MHKKLTATLTIAIFAISTFAIVSPVSAHFTLGDLTGTYRYHNNDFDPHVPGVIGYVWPGGGQNGYSGDLGFATVNFGPGYQTPYPGGKPPVLGGANQYGGAPSPSWYQLEGDAYAPFGAVLTGSTGDLIFALNATKFATVAAQQAGTGPLFTGRWDTLAIFLPPGFVVPSAAQVVSTISNDYSGIGVLKIGPYDRYVPGWTMVYVEADAGGMASNDQKASGATPTYAYYDHQFVDFSAAGEWYYVRINGVTAPTVAGKYFFKIFLSGSSNSIGGPEGTAGSAVHTNGGCIGTATKTPPMLELETCSQFIPTENFPVMLVKGEIDPAIMTGTIRYGGYNTTLYGQPVQEPGRVYAKMTSRLDPYTGNPRPDLPLVNAMGYFNATAMGHYEVEGLAAGVYDLYASAAGYPQTLITSKFTVIKGQSLHFDGYLQPGPVIHGNVFTKHQFGDEPWPWPQAPYNATVAANGESLKAGTYPGGSYIKIELYDGPTLNHIPDAKANMVSWSPLPCVAGGQQAWYGRRDAGYCDDPRLGAKIGFPWHEYNVGNGYGDPSLGFYQVSAGDNIGTFWNDQFQDPQGIGPPQHWSTQGGLTNPFHFEFGVKGEYGAPRDLDGMVPQAYATWINGLTAGRYYVRAWTFRYVQSALDGATFQEYYFDVTPNEWAGDVTLPLDLRLSSWVNKTVHFHNIQGGITEEPIDTGAGLMAGMMVDANGIAWSYNQTLLGYEGYYGGGGKRGWGAAAFSLPWGNAPNTVKHANDLDKAKSNKYAVETGRANIQFWGANDTWGGENYGIPSGTYTPHVYVLGYVEQGPVEQVSVTLSGNPTIISDHMNRGPGFNITVYSIDWQRPRVSRQWVWGNAAGYTATGPATTAGALGYIDSAHTPNGLACCTQNGVPWTISPPAYSGMVGQEIQIGFYNNGTLIDMYGDEMKDFGGNTLPDTVMTSCLFQASAPTPVSLAYTGAMNSSVQMCGGGWEPLYAPLGSTPGAFTGGSLGIGTYSLYQGNSNDAYFGQEIRRPGFVGGYLSGSFYFETATKLNLNSVIPATAGRQPVPGDPTAWYNSAYLGNQQLLPTALPSGLQYDLRAYTYGYVQDKKYSTYGASGQVADMMIDLVIGVNVTLDILFKKEHIITPTSANMSARVRLFDDSGSMVAEWMSSEGTYVTGGFSSTVPSTHGFARAADGTYQYPFGPQWPTIIGSNDPNTGNVLYPLNGYNYLPGGTTLLHVQMAGLPTIPPGGTQNGNGIIGGNKLDVNGAFFGDPIFPNLQSTNCGDIEMACFAKPGSSSFAPAFEFFPNYGILGSPDYQGGWTAEVDFVNWYNNNTATTIWPTFSPGGTGFPFTITTDGANYYPPVTGLLMGESYHIIPGTTAKNGISLVDDITLNKAGWGRSLAPNHLGPYSQEGAWQIAGAHLSGEASANQEVDLNGLVSGNVLAFMWSSELRPLSWGTITVTGAGLPSTGLTFYTFDGLYELYLPGTAASATGGSVAYKFTLTTPGYVSQSWTVAVSAGMTGGGLTLYLEESNIPVPEFNGIAVVAFSALAASLYLLRRRRK